MKIILGAGKTTYDGWISTQENELNLLNTEDFARISGVLLRFFTSSLLRLRYLSQKKNSKNENITGFVTGAW